MVCSTSDPRLSKSAARRIVPSPIRPLDILKHVANSTTPIEIIEKFNGPNFDKRNTKHLRFLQVVSALALGLVAGPAPRSAPHCCSDSSVLNAPPMVNYLCISTRDR